MPAVTVDDITTLPHIPAPDPAAATIRPVVSVTTAPHGLEGEGFPVRRAFAGTDPALIDPFIHMDQMGEVEYAPGEPKGTPWHPHRGFETVTYMIDGTFQHQDSNGGGGLITNGDTQWMTAGAGILHIERPPDALIASGGLFHGIQLWEVGPRPLPGHPCRQRRAAHLVRRRRVAARHRRGGRGPQRARHHLHAHLARARDDLPQRPSAPALAA
jgi:quercetin 2,3-dioxygenase